MAECGEGNLNWPGILAGMQDRRRRNGTSSNRTPAGRDPFESLAISLRNLKAMGLH